MLKYPSKISFTTIPRIDYLEDDPNFTIKSCKYEEHYRGLAQSIVDNITIPGNNFCVAKQEYLIYAKNKEPEESEFNYDLSSIKTINGVITTQEHFDAVIRNLDYYKKDFFYKV